MSQFIVTTEQLKDIFEEGFMCSAEGFNAEWGLEYLKNNKQKSLLETKISSNDYAHNEKYKNTYLEVFNDLLKNLKEI